MDIKDLIKREKARAKEYLRDTIEPHYLMKIETALKSGGVDSETIAKDNDFVFVKVVFNIIGEAETPLSNYGEQMKKNLEKFI